MTSSQSRKRSITKTGFTVSELPKDAVDNATVSKVPKEEKKNKKVTIQEPLESNSEEDCFEKVPRKVISLDDDSEEEEDLPGDEFFGDNLDDSDDFDDDLDDEMSEGTEEDEEEGPSESVPEKLLINQETESDEPLTMKEMREKIQMILLAMEKKQYQPGTSRADYIKELKETLCKHYDYSEYMLETLFHLFRPSEFVDFLEANEAPRPVTIRANTLKTRRRDLAAALIARGVNVEPLDKWTPVALQVFEGKVPIGATPEYLAGHYMLQAAASLLPVMSLNPASNQKCLDMCAAPGGKSTHMAAMMGNTGFLACNDVSSDRIQALNANLHRMGVQNAVVSCLDGRKLVQYYGASSFDRILLDAPCSGTGVISKDPGVKGKTSDDFKSLGQLQRELLAAAVEMCCVNGHIVYSTCSVTVEENEQVVDWAVKKYKVRIVDSGLSFGTPGMTAFRGHQFDKAMAKTMRYYPHTHNLDGFYVAKLERYA